MIARVVVGLAVLVVVASAVLLYRGEWIREEIDTGFTSVAMRDPLLASRRFLDAHGHETRRLEVLGVGIDLPPQEGVLLFLAARLALGDTATDTLDAWVRGGGHLITVPASSADEVLHGREDKLLHGLGVSLEQPPDEGSQEDRARQGDGVGERDDGEPDYDRNGCQVWPLMQAQLPETREQLAIGTPVHARLLIAPAPGSPGRVLAHDERGTFLYSTAYGRGRVTVVADAEIWSNSDVGCVDHAHLLLRLVGEAGPVWFVDQAERPTLLALLLREGPPLLVSGAVLLALWLWRAGGRFGPIVPSPLPVRRERAESVRAAGEYLWRQRAIADLLSGLRARVRMVARRRFGSEGALSALATRARIPVERAEAAMQVDPRHERDFIATTRTLKELVEQS